MRGSRRRRDTGLSLTLSTKWVLLSVSLSHSVCACLRMEKTRDLLRAV